MVGIEPGFNEETQPVRAVSTKVKNRRSSDSLIDLPVHRKKKVLVGLRADQVPCRVISNDHRVRAGLKLGHGKGDGHLLQSLKKVSDLIRVGQRP